MLNWLVGFVSVFSMGSNKLVTDEVTDEVADEVADGVADDYRDFIVWRGNHMELL